MGEGMTINAETLSQLQNDSWNKYILENKELLETMSHLLRGEMLVPVTVKDKETQEEFTEMYWQKPTDKSGKLTQKPPINEKGYYFTMLHISQALDKSQASGNLSEEQAMNSLNQLMKSLTAVYITKYNEFELQTLAETKTLLISIMNLVKTHITKSIDMALIKQLASSYTITEQRFNQLPKQEGNLTM